MKKNFIFLAVKTIIFAAIALPAVAAENKIQGMLCRAGTVIGNSAVVIVVISWIFVGVFFLASVGNTERFSSAKKALYWVIIGTIVLLLAASAITMINSAMGTSGGGIDCP